MGVGSRFAGCIFAIACAACSVGSSTDPSAPLAKPEAAPQVQAVMEKMRERYRTARTYSDEGTYRSVSRGPNGDVVASFTARVRTRWAAPDRLRFEFHEDPSEFLPARTIAVWTPRPGITRSWFLDREREEPSLDDALGALQGVSHGTTGLAPRWLHDGGCRCTAQYELRGTTSCGRGTCFALAGSLAPGRRVTLFVDTGNHALRRVVWTTTRPLEPIAAKRLESVAPERREELRLALEAGRWVESEDTMEIEPTFDHPLEPTAFDFAPPPPSKTP